MRVVAAVFADFQESFLGGPAPLLTELAGRRVIDRTLSRLMQVEGLDARCLFVRPRDQDVAEQVVRELGLAGRPDVLALDDGRRLRRGLIRAARKCNLDAWRGSLLGTTWFDEFVEPQCVARVLDHYRCEAVLCLDGCMPALAPEIATAMLAQAREHEAEARMMFTQAPPGLAGVVLRCEIVRELLELALPLGILLSYRPERPCGDPINQPACMQVDAAIGHTAIRLRGDTRRSRALLSEALGELGDALTAAELCKWLRLPGHERAGPLPLEVELELTTDDPLPETRLRPRGSRVPRRVLTDVDAVERVARELASYDDRLMVLAGHGDPLAHPRFGEICRRIRSAGVCGLAVVSPLVHLSDENFEVLFANRIDAVEVLLDANTPETYSNVNGADYFARVVANVERIEQARRTRLCPQPIVACSLTRCALTLPEMDEFYDRWIRATGSAILRGYNDYCNRLPVDSLLATEPSVRSPCRRLGTRMTLLADGTAALCGQDYTGEHVIGRWNTEPLTHIWRSGLLQRVRRTHAAGGWSSLPLCASCHDWFRP